VDCGLVNVDVHGRSVTGAEHSVNAVRFLVADLKNLPVVNGSRVACDDDHRRCDGTTQGQLLLVVADGVEPNAAGQRASAIAVDCLTDHLVRCLDPCGRGRAAQLQELQECFQDALRNCRAAMDADALANPQFRQMSTTLTVAYVVWPQLFLVHAGDSRCYLHRNSRLRRLTTDHTIAQKMVQAGMLPADRVQSSPWNNVLWNAVGTGVAQRDADVQQTHLMAADVLLLCTGGLARCLPDARIAAIVQRKEPAESICRCLLQTARQVDGTDDVTVVVARFV
jgi:protein phosphatase